MRAFQVAAIIVASVQVSAKFEATVTIPAACESSCSGKFADMNDLKSCLDSVVATTDPAKCRTGTVSFSYTDGGSDAQCQDATALQLSFAAFLKEVDALKYYSPTHVLKEGKLGYKVTTASSSKCNKVSAGTVEVDDICKGSASSTKMTANDLTTNIKLIADKSAKIDFTKVKGLLATGTSTESKTPCAFEKVTPYEQSLKIDSTVTIKPNTFTLINAKVEFNPKCTVRHCAEAGEKTAAQIQTCLDDAAKTRGCATATYTRTFEHVVTDTCAREANKAPVIQMDIGSRMTGEQNLLTSIPDVTKLTEVYFSKKVVDAAKCGKAVLTLGEDCTPGKNGLNFAQSDNAKLHFSLDEVVDANTKEILVTFTKAEGCKTKVDTAGDKVTLVSTFTIENIAPSSAYSHVSLGALLVGSIFVLAAF